MNAFMVFSHIERKKIIEFQPDIHNAEVSKALGKRWKELSSEGKEPYIQEAERLRLLHMQEYPDYKYRPRKKPQKGSASPTNAKATPLPSTTPPGTLLAVPTNAKIFKETKSGGGGGGGGNNNNCWTAKNHNQQHLRVTIDEGLRKQLAFNQPIALVPIASLPGKSASGTCDQGSSSPSASSSLISSCNSSPTTSEVPSSPDSSSSTTSSSAANVDSSAESLYQEIMCERSLPDPTEYSLPQQQLDGFHHQAAAASYPEQMCNASSFQYHYHHQQQAQDFDHHHWGCSPTYSHQATTTTTTTSLSLQDCSQQQQQQQHYNSGYGHHQHATSDLDILSELIDQEQQQQQQGGFLPHTSPYGFPPQQQQQEDQDDKLGGVM